WLGRLSPGDLVFDGPHRSDNKGHPARCILEAVVGTRRFHCRPWRHSCLDAREPAPTACGISLGPRERNPSGIAGVSALLAVFRAEFSRIFQLRPAFSVLVIAVALYAVYYPQPYLNEALRKVPVA